MEKIIERVEIDYLKQLVKHLESGQMSVDDARSSARTFLDMLPFASEEDIEVKIDTYCATWPLFAMLRVSVKAAEDEIHTTDVIEQMRALLKSGDIDGALRVSGHS